MEDLVINGAECEPFITCDDLLMRERADEVVRGIAPSATCCSRRGADRHRGQQAGSRRRHAAAMQAAGEIRSHPCRRYPAGGAKQLIRVLTGIEVPTAALHRLRRAVLQRRHRLQRLAPIAHGEPLVSRIVTVAGNVHEPRNYEVLIGTPMDDLLTLARRTRTPTATSWAAR
jgi:electron transport complex protein RnfC